MVTLRFFQFCNFENTITKDIIQYATYRDWLFFFFIIIMPLKYIQVVVCIDKPNFYLSPNSIPNIYLVKDILVASGFWHIKNLRSLFFLLPHCCIAHVQVKKILWKRNRALVLLPNQAWFIPEGLKR